MIKKWKVKYTETITKIMLIESDSEEEARESWIDDEEGEIIFESDIDPCLVSVSADED